MRNKFIAKNVVKMVGYVPGEQPSDNNVVKLNTNENPYPPSPRVIEELSKISAESLRKYPDPFCKHLRAFVAKKFNCSDECIFIGNGSDEILSLAAKAFVEDDGTIGYIEPSYSLYPVIAQIRNVKVKPIYTDRYFQWDIPKNYKVSLFYLTNPNAPSGVQYDIEFVKKFCKKMKNGVVLIDEAYVDFARENALELAFNFDNVLVMRTLSKSYSLAGLRVGFVFGDKELIKALFKIKDSYNVDAIAQHLAVVALEDDKYFKKVVDSVITERENLSFILRSYDFDVLPSSTNFIFVRPPKPFDAEWLFNELRKRNIFVRYFPGKITGDGIRITIGTREQTIALVTAIQKICKLE